MRRRDLRLLPLAVAVWAVALLCVLLPAAAWGCAALCGAGAVSVVAHLLHRRGSRARPSACGGILVVVLSAAAGAALAVGFAQPVRERVSEEGDRVVEIVADVTSSASIGQDGRLWFDAATAAVGPPGQTEATAAPVRIGIEPRDGFELGARIRVVGEASATDAGERATLVVFASEAEVVELAGGVFAAAATLKHAFVARSLRLPEPGAGLLPGLAVGDTRAVTPELNDDMRTSGLSHLTAVSGVKVTVTDG